MINLSITMGFEQKDLPVGKVAIVEALHQRLLNGESFTLSPILMKSDHETILLGVSLNPEPAVELVEVKWPKPNG